MYSGGGRMLEKSNVRPLAYSCSPVGLVNSNTPIYNIKMLDI